MCKKKIKVELDFAYELDKIKLLFLKENNGINL